MPPAKTTGRIAIDYRFAPAPHELILDPHISPPAFRLWCVLAYMDWTHEPPSLPLLQGYMQQANGDPPTRRSIYRWLGELETRGWIEWIRAPGKAGINDRVTVKTRANVVTSGSQLGKPVTPESQPVIVGSQVVTLGSQVDYFQALSEPPEKTTQNRSDHDQIMIGDDRDRRTLEFLENEGIGAAKEFACLPYDPMRLDYQNRIAAGQSIATIVKAWRRKPPTETYHYERSRPIQPNDAPDRRRPSERLGERPALPPGLKLAGRKLADSGD
jgi:hypothetical protein